MSCPCSTQKIIVPLIIVKPHLWIFYACDVPRNKYLIVINKLNTFQMKTNRIFGNEINLFMVLLHIFKVLGEAVFKHLCNKI